MLTDAGTRYVTQTGKGTPREAQPSRLAVVVIGVFGLLFVALPLLALTVVGVSPAFTGEVAPSTWTLDNFRLLFDNKTASDAITNSLVVAVGGVVVALVAGYLIADVLYRARGVGFVRSTIDVIVNLPLGVPAVVFGAGFLYTYTQGPVMLYGTRWVIILVYLTLMLPFTTRLQLAARMSLGDSFEEAAAVCGAGIIRTHATIVLPLTRTALSGAAAIMFVLLTHEFAASLLVRSIDSQVMGTVLFNLLDVSSNAAAAMALLMCILTTIGVALAIWAGGGTKTLDRL
jgi:iron(III) transport system permease protein